MYDAFIIQINMKQVIRDFQAGCSAISWNTEDSKVLFGRNFDLNRMADITKITYFPKDYIYYTCGTKREGNRREETKQKANYATVGTGLFMEENSPVLYEGINEYGLMGAQLNYRVFAHFSKEIEENTMPIQPAFFVYHMLAQYKSISQIIEAVEKEITFLAVPMAGVIPTLHWMFTDATGESVVIESEEDGIKIHKNTLGIPWKWQFGPPAARRAYWQHLQISAYLLPRYRMNSIIRPTVAQTTSAIPSPSRLPLI